MSREIFHGTMTIHFTFSPLTFFLLFLPHCGGFIGIHRGRSTRASELANGYEIVIPRKVRSDGELVSHRIPHHFERSFYKDQALRNDASPDDVLHYRLQIDDEEHHLELRPNHRLVAPGAVIEEHTSTLNGREDNKLNGIKFRRMRDAQCHYHGHVRNHTENSALSTCYGLAGYIRTKRSWYMIEPVADHDFTKEEEQPHIVYKSGPDEFRKDTEILCNVTGNVSKAIAKRAFNSRRNISCKEAKSYTLELLVVLEKMFLDYRSDFDIENYALTLLNMAAGLLHDASLGFPIELTIVRIIRMEVEDNEISPSASKDIGENLKKFQEWQEAMNPGDDSHPNHHDCAILITKTDVCVSQNLCGFTGTSTIAGTCDPLKGAAIVRDVGLPTGHHIAHHIGHTLGMSHDIEEDNGCPGVIYHGKGYIETTVMHPGSVYVTKKWSKCSRDYLKTFIEAGLGFCLKDEPEDYNFPSMDLLPGVMYNGDDQCRLLYRPDSRQCDLGITCEALRCAVPGMGCVSTSKPPAEGTSCGEKRWCREMKCLMIGDRPGATDGGWSTWSRWSRCSRSCGSGVASSVRRCNNPSPSNGGAYCRGDRKRHKICATNPCDIDAPSFRDVQCAEFNDWTFPEDGKLHRWTAYNLPEDLKASENPCALYCLSETNSVASLRPKVTDGTTCYRGIRDICIGGICREIPCDLNMESHAVEDVCGVCKGDGTSCRLKEGRISFATETRERKVVVVPAGSTNIRVEETEPTKSRITVKTRDDKVLIDGNRLGMFDVPGTKAWLGMIRPRQEALNIPGPVRVELHVLVLPIENVTVKYSFGLKEKAPRKAKFSWDFIDWGQCTANCGPGEQISLPRCVEKVSGLVDDLFCRNISKPEAKVRPCYQAPCLPRWLIGDWQGCPSCMAGCEKRRAVKCVRPVGHAEQDVDIIADSFCQGPKPKEQEPCTGRRRRDNILTRDGKNKNSAAGLKPRNSPVEELRDHVDPYAEIMLIESEGLENVRDDHATVGKRSEKKKLKKKENIHEIQRDEMVIDKEDIKNLTLAVILQRDEENNLINFPKNFEPQPRENVTEFILIGMDAIRYIQMIQDDTHVSPKVLPL